MKLKHLTTPLVLATVLATSSAVSAGNNANSAPSTGGEKAGVCHVNGNGTAKLINVSRQALVAHAMHGDGLPGGDVAGMPNFIYDGDCVPVEDGIAAGCFDSAFFLDLDFDGEFGKSNNASFSNSMNGSCTGYTNTPVTLVEAADASAALDTCKRLGAERSSVVSARRFGYGTLPDSAYLC